MLFGGGLLVLLGLLSLLQLPKVISEARRADRESIRVTGRVVELTEEPPTGSDSEASTWHPVVEFEDRDGREHTFQARYGTTPAKWAVGDPIEVAYPPLKPEQARIDHPFMAYQPVLIAVLIGIVFLGFGAGLVLIVLQPR